MATRAYYGSSGRPRHKSNGHRSVAMARHRRKRALDEECGFFSTGLTLQEPHSLTIRAWLAFQILALLLQGHFWQEVRGNISLYEETLRTNCAPERSKHGVCMGPLWNVSAWEEFVLQGRSSSWHSELKPRPYRLESFSRYLDSVEAIDAEIAHLQQETAARIKELRDKRAELEVTQGLIPLGNGTVRAGSGISRSFNSTYIFQFDTHFAPVIFLLSVEPIQRPGESTKVSGDEDHENVINENGHWSLEVKRLEPPPAGDQHFQRAGSGSKVLTIEDMSREALNSVQKQGYVRWEAIIRNSAFSSRMSRGSQRFMVFVEDFQSPHLGQILPSSSCSLTAAWRAFNKQHQGHHHRALAWCRDLLGWLLPLGALATWAVYSTSVAQTEKTEDLELNFEAQEEEKDVERNGQRGYFQSVILIKLLVMDIPQQICIVLYLLGWYEADGLRCQLCLFHPQHCEAEHPFRFVNSAAFLCTLLSSVSNQVVLGPSKTSKKGTEAAEGEVCTMWTIRIGLICAPCIAAGTALFVSSFLYSLFERGCASFCHASSVGSLF
ncbi:unnamed protein product [Durusdinium trenchii]|uniref:Uncharacterized protein n=2 Tax=Durusdinium trenchii TaxID=1381693 RepID=A0ABP0Q2G8_9DINO